MINRIRDIRRQKGMTLADVAALCSPPTTAQTIGRLETGMRNLSLAWMNRIAAALEVEPGLLVRADENPQARLVARLTDHGAEALNEPRDALLPTELTGGRDMMTLSVETSAGDYRVGDQVWLRRIESEGYPRLLNRDVLAPRTGGRFAFGRLVELSDNRATVLPPALGGRPVTLEAPPWLAVAEMLVRRL